MQGKHDALARRVDDLDQACCNLRDELAESEDAQEQLMEQLKEAQGEVKQLKEQLQQEKVTSELCYCPVVEGLVHL